LILGCVAAATLVLRAPDSKAGNAPDPEEQARCARGLSISPVPMNVEGKDAFLVGLGSYIVNAQGGCNDCHTDPAYERGHDPFRGSDGRVNAASYLNGGKVMGEGIIATDLTPDTLGRPGGLTLEQFEHAMTTGEDPMHPGRILQVMPWPVYRNMTERDLRAIYEYLRAIPASPRHAVQPR
jgi:hypothetical protein